MRFTLIKQWKICVLKLMSRLLRSLVVYDIYVYTHYV